MPQATPESDNSESTERRRHERRATRWAVRILVPATAKAPAQKASALDAEIREYSDSGLFAALHSTVAQGLSRTALRGATVSIEFKSQGANAANATGETYTATGRIVYVSSTGLGIAVTTMPAGARHWLESASAKLASSVADIAESKPPKAVASALIKSCSTHFRAALETLETDFFDGVSKQLADIKLSSSGSVTVTPRQAARQALAESRSAFHAQFFSEIDAGIRRLQFDEAEPLSLLGRDLQLMDDAELEHFLAVTRIIERVESSVTPQLGELERRLGLLVHRQVMRATNPFGPTVVCRAFRGALSGVRIAPEIWPGLYQSFEDLLLRDVQRLYHNLTKALSTLRFATLPKAVSPAVSPIRPEAVKPVAETPLSPPLAAAPKAASKPKKPSTRATVAASAAPSTGDLFSLVAQTNRDASDNSNGPDVAVDKLLNAINALPATRAGDATQTPLSALLDAKLGSGASLSSDQRSRIDSVEQLLQRGWQALAPNSSVRALVQRLDRPLQKLALTDTAFPATGDHPARHVVNLLDEFAIATDDAGRFLDPALEAKLAALIEQIRAMADGDPAVFARVREQLEAELRPLRRARRARVERAQEALAARDCIRTARVQVDETLARRLSGRRIPRVIFDLLDGGLRHVFVLSVMRGRASSPDWGAGLALLDRIVEGCAPNAANSDGNATNATSTTLNAPAVMIEVERALASAAVDEQLHEEILNDVGHYLGKHKANTDGGTVEWVDLPPQDPAKARSQSEFPAALHGVRIGDWWDIATPSGRAPMQLVWMSYSSAMCAFANRSGTSNIERTFSELSQQIEDGRAVRAANLALPAVDRSELGLVDEAFQDLLSEATLDSVSGLPNQKGLLLTLAKLPAPSDTTHSHTVCVVEFDQFRMIANTCGFEAVERLTRDLAGRIAACFAESAVVASIREGTFALLLPDMAADTARSQVKQMVATLKDSQFRHEEHRYSLGIHVGISDFLPAQCSNAEIIRRADSACLTARALGRNNLQVYELTNQELLRQESVMSWAGRIDTLLAGKGMHLRSQKVQPLNPAKNPLPIYEILLGVGDGPEHTQRPGEFVSAVEQLRRAHEIDVWVITKTFEWIHNHRALFDAMQCISINLSASSLANAEVKTFLQETLPHCGIPAEKIMFEITETAAIRSYTAAQEFIRDIRRYGCKFALDDFGTGFTSYAHLKLLQCDMLKIDGGFVVDMLNNPQDLAMVKSMNDIAHALGMQTVAEWVESPEVLAKLTEIGVDYAQGYTVHRPGHIDLLSTDIPAAA